MNSREEVATRRAGSLQHQVNRSLRAGEHQRLAGRTAPTTTWPDDDGGSATFAPGSSRPLERAARGSVALRLETPRAERQASEEAVVAVVWPMPLEVVRRLVEVSERQGAALGDFAVLVGGSAMAAHGIRAGSRDVEVYTPVVAEAAVAQVEAEYRARFGSEFPLDVTTVENVWGLVMIRDIAEAPLVAEIETATGRRFAVRTLAVEDLFVLKVASG